MMDQSNDNGRIFERTMEETEDEFDEIERNTLEEVLREQRRQSPRAWVLHVIRGFGQALMFLGVYYLINLLFLLGGPVPSDADFTAEELQLAVAVRLSMFAACWAGAITANWWMARRDIQRTHAAQRRRLAAEQQARREVGF
jgi:hypothetical protein